MRGSDVVRMVISPCSSHSFGILVVWHDIAVVRELFEADCTYSALFGDFPLQKVPHFCGGPEFPISPRVVWVFDALNTEAYGKGFWDWLPTTTRHRSVNRTEFIPTQSHGFLLEVRSSFGCS